MTASIVRFDSDQVVTIDKMIRIGQADTYIARAYEKQIFMSGHGNRVSYNGRLYGSIIDRLGGTEKQEKADKQEAYKVIEKVFPELAGIGERTEGYIRYSIEELQKTGIIQ